MPFNAILQSAVCNTAILNISFIKIVIDRFEGDFAVAELPDKTFLNVPAKLFENCKEGDIFEITKNNEKTEEKKEKIEKLMNKLFE